MFHRALGSKVSPPQIAEPSPEVASGTDSATEELSVETQALTLDEGK